MSSLSSSISSSSISPLSLLLARNSLLIASLGRLKLVLRLDDPLPGLPPLETLPTLEKDVRRDPCSLGAGLLPREEYVVWTGEAAWLDDELALPPRSSDGISVYRYS